MERDDYLNKILCGDALEVLRSFPDGVIDTCVTSPPYWGLRDYGVEGQLGLEPTPEEYTAKMVEIFREVRRVLKDEGTLWLNLGDSYAKTESNNSGYSDKSTLAGFTNPNTKGRQSNEVGTKIKLNHNLKPKDLCGIPWRIAFALQADGWYLRSDIIWSKPNPLPESVTDRPTKAHEYIFLMSKNERYYYDHEAIKEDSVDIVGSSNRYKKPFFVGEKHESGGYSPNGAKHTAGMKEFDGKRNKRTVWTVSTHPFPEAHFATFPEKLIEPCILAGSPEKGIVLDPFMGAGTTAKVALRLNRNFTGIEINPEYKQMAEKRIQPLLMQTRLF